MAENLTVCLGNASQSLFFTKGCKRVGCVLYKKGLKMDFAKSSVLGIIDDNKCSSKRAHRAKGHFDPEEKVENTFIIISQNPKKLLLRP